MRKFKMVLGYILGFISALLLTVLTFCCILRLTIFNKEYVLQRLADNDYYEEVTEGIKKDMEYSILSSGLDKSVLEGIFKDGEVKVDIKGFIASLYTGSKYETKTSSVKKKLNSNINNYLKEKNLQINEGSSLKKYVDGVAKIYKDGVEMYGYLNGYTKSLSKVMKLNDVLIGVSIVIIILNLAIIRYYCHRRYFGVACLSGSLMLLFVRLYIYEGIDFKNILIISDSFSKVIRKILTDIGDKIVVISLVLFVISILLNIKNSMRKVKRVKRLH